MTPPLPARAVFVGCARDCAASLRHVLRNIERMAGLFDEAGFVFVENDSVDETKAILRGWCAGRGGAELIERDGLAAACPVRTVRLAQLRNLYLAHVRERFAEFDYLIVVDCDDVNNLVISLTGLREAIGFLAADPARAGAFPNQDHLYYDLWALRHPQLCPDDVWEAVFDDVIAHGGTDAEAFHRIFAPRLGALFRRGDPPVEVASAFGGMGIYKLASVLNNPRPYAGYKTKIVGGGRGARALGWQVCEHVAFNAGFGEAGEKLFILPGFVNGRTPDYYALARGLWPVSAFREFVFELDWIGAGV